MFNRKIGLSIVIICGLLWAAAAAAPLRAAQSVPANAVPVYCPPTYLASGAAIFKEVDCSLAGSDIIVTPVAADKHLIITDIIVTASGTSGIFQVQLFDGKDDDAGSFDMYENVIKLHGEWHSSVSLHGTAPLITLPPEHTLVVILYTSQCVAVDVMAQGFLVDDLTYVPTSLQTS